MVVQMFCEFKKKFRKHFIALPKMSHVSILECGTKCVFSTTTRLMKKIQCKHNNHMTMQMFGDFNKKQKMFSHFAKDFMC